MHARRPRALCAAMLCAGSLWAVATHARTPRPARAPSTPSTAQILAPSSATVPDALPTDHVVYRCGNSYSAQPCAEANALNVDDPRTDAQRLQAAEIAARDKRLASWMEAGRRERDGAASEPEKRRARVNKACVANAAVTCDVRKSKVRRAKSIAPSKVAPSGGK